MPVLRFPGADGADVERILQRTAGSDGRTPPLTVGHGEEADQHICVPNATLRARILGSSIATWYAYILAGRNVQVNGAAIEAVRVLRHGDRVGLGEANVLYLDFTMRGLAAGSDLLHMRCALTNCERGLFSVGDDIATCPWCGKAYHAGCWLWSERCRGAENCYPVRRLLLAELGDGLKWDKMPETKSSYSRLCTAGCAAVDDRGLSTTAAPINPGEAILRCPNDECYRPYHPACWLSFRAPCVCGFDIPRFIDGSIERSEGLRTR